MQTSFQSLLKSLSTALPAYLNLLPTAPGNVAPTAQSAVARVATACAKRMCILGKPTGRAWEAQPTNLTTTQQGWVCQRLPIRKSALQQVGKPALRCLREKLRCAPAALAALVAISPVQAQTDLKFTFGGEAKPGWTQVLPANLYSTNTGYGFEPGARLSAEKNAVTSVTPFYFSAKLPEGNYRVTVVLGGDAIVSTNTVKAELRRLMLEKIPVAAGDSVARTFIVNLRTPEIPGGHKVHLKPRETQSEWWDWDDKMTLEFNGENPSVRTLEIEPASVPTVYVIGDSTVCDQPAEPWNSWGQMLPRFFKPVVAVANHAESGEAINSSLHALRFAKIFSLMNPGDYLFVQFGHNDQKDHATNALVVYQANLKKIVAMTREKGGTPVLVTSMERKGGVEHDTLAGYPDAVRAVAREEKCALIDLNKMSRVFYRALGGDIGLAFQDGTHHNNYGSYELAKCIVEGIKQDKLPLTADVVDDFGDFDPSHPDSVKEFHMAVSPNASTLKPLGN
jgi:lysophospholipase L1-like esterase